MTFRNLGSLARHLAVLLTFLLLLADAFRNGWRRTGTDFANYYTAAVLVRQGKPLHNYYDWTWFARQMNYAGFERQLGAYTPQTPLTMLPVVGLVGFPPQRAKQIWLMSNLVFLGTTIWLLSRVSRLSVENIWLLAFCGYSSLRTNFLYGQYYVFLLFLLTLAFYFLHRKNRLLGGLTTGVAFGLKLYGGPFLLYFIARRQWKALSGMAATALLLLGVAIALFGVADVHNYATQILPRSLEGGPVDPYNTGMATFSNLLMHLFVREPELNPRPFLEAPWLSFFLRTFISLVVVSFLYLYAGLRRATSRHDFAWFMIAAVLLSTSTASYTFILLLLPVVLLLEESGPRQSIFLVISYLLITFPLPGAWLFPKVWLLFALFVAVGLRRMAWRMACAVMVIAAVAAVFDASRRMLDYEKEPGQRFERIAVQRAALFSSFPAVLRAGIFYQSMGKDRYVLRWLHDNRIEELSFEGHALHPRASPDGSSIYFELVANRISTMMQFDPAARTARPLSMPVPGDSVASLVSPDGKWIAYETARDGPMHIWIRDVASGREQRLTDGNCNSSSPVWELDSQSILFASDCGRAFGLPALYRAKRAQWEY